MTLTTCEAQLTLNDWTAGEIDWYYQGKLARPGFPKEKLFERFLSKVAIVGDCWEWQRYKNDAGYGQFHSGLIYPSGASMQVKAHRFSLSVRLGRDLLPGMQALHSCDNPPCVRPDHLREGTQSENVRDSLARGRHVAPNALKSACPAGHPYTEENTYAGPDGSRHCRECSRAWHRAAYQERQVSSLSEAA